MPKITTLNLFMRESLEKSAEANQTFLVLLWNLPFIKFIGLFFRKIRIQTQIE